MALGLPVVGNDNPDQALVLRKGDAGLCVPLTAKAFARAVLDLLKDEERRQQMAQSGQRYVRRERGYDRLARQVAEAYRQFFAEQTVIPAKKPVVVEKAE